MAKTKAAHHRGTYDTRSRRLTKAANANPETRCWRCHRTITEVRRTKPKAIWTAGHLVAGQANGRLAPECSPCNYSHGGKLGITLRSQPKHTSATW